MPIGRPRGHAAAARKSSPGKTGGWHFAAGAVAGEDARDEIEYAATAHDRGELREEDFVVDVREKFRDIAFQDKGVAVRELAAAFPCGGRAFTDLAGKASGDEAPLQQRREPVAQRVMQHAVAKGCGGDEPALWFVDFEKTIRTREVAAGEQFLPQRRQLRLAPHPPFLHIGPPALAAARFACREEEIVP